MATIWHYIKQIKTIFMNVTENEMEIKDREFELLDFSDEILLEIFSKFNDIDLLNTAQVCKRFTAIAKEIFAKKYNGDSNEKYYEIKVYADDTKEDQKLYQTFLKKFGNEITAINFISERAPNQHHMLKVISQYCPSTKRITIYGGRHTFHLMQMIQPMSKLTNLTVKAIHCTNFYWTDVRFPHLTTFHMDDIPNVDVQVLKQFLYVNPQLEHLHITDCRKFPLKVIQALRDKMKKLKSLEYDSNDNTFGNSCRDINMEQLESLKITVDATSFRTVLEAIARGSKLIQHLDIMMRNDDSNLEGVHIQIDNVIPLFVKLKSLRLESFDLTVDVTRYLIRFLPHLIVLKLDGVKLFEFRPDDVLFIFKKCYKLKELSLESGTHTIETGKFNSEFHRQFREEIVQSRGCDVKFELNQPETKMTITAEKMIKNDELIFWTEYEVKTRSKVHFLDLGDKCLRKIYSYLDEQSERALYETCIRTKEAMHERIMKQVFTVFDLSSAKDTFNRFGEHITKLAIDLNTKNHGQIAVTWSFIGAEFNGKITELSFINVKVSAVDSLRIKFPNVTTLKIMSVVTSRTHIFPPMDCPKLSHIEFHKGDITFANKATNFGLSLDHLTTIKLSNFNVNIGKIIHLLDDKICDKLQEFSVYRTQETQYTHMQLANIAMRFRNITTLNFCVPSIELTNTKYLFASCTKLVKVVFGYDSYFELNDWRRTIQHIKDNCKHLEVFQLVRNYYGFDQDLLHEIADKLSNVKLYTVCYDENRKTYKVESFRRTTKADRNTPF